MATKRKRRTYKPTRTVTIKDVPNAYADLFNALLDGMIGQLGPAKIQTKAEAFQEIVINEAERRLGREILEWSMEKFRKRDRFRAEQAQIEPNDP